MDLNIQRSILSTFLWADDLGMDKRKAFMLDESLFTGQTKQIAKMINAVTATDDRYYGLLNLNLENNPQLHQEWLFIAEEQTPMTFRTSKAYYTQLLEKNKNSSLKGLL